MMGVEVAEGITTQEWILTGAAIVSAVGTIGAVFTALFLIPWKERRRRPRLSVTFDSASEFDFMVGVPTQGRGCSHWVPPRVHNEVGKDSAVNVEVVFIEMRNLGTGEPLQFENRCLEWSGVRLLESDLEATLARGGLQPRDVVALRARLLSS